jgi:hypothetical protein
MNDFIKDRRLGRFSIHREFLEGGVDRVKMLAFMQNFVVVRAEYMYATESFEYQAFSPLFDVIDRGDLIPEYMFAIYTDGKVEAERVNR